MAVPADIYLGDGVFSIGATSSDAVAIALTRGGGVFSLEREHRLIEADGDYGPVKERIRMIREVAKLNMKGLEIVPCRTEDYYPAITASDTSSATSVTTGGVTITFTTRSLTTNITSEDYNWVQWVGYSKGGRQVLIALENAINLEGLNWDLIDKEEIINEMTFQATYGATTRATAPWKVYFTTTST